MKFFIYALPEKNKPLATGTHRTAQKGYPEKAIAEVAEVPLKRTRLFLLCNNQEGVCYEKSLFLSPDTHQLFSLVFCNDHGIG